MKFNVHMMVRQDGALGLPWPYATQIDADSEELARSKVIEFVREFHNLETMEIRSVSRTSHEDQPQ